MDLLTVRRLLSIVKFHIFKTKFKFSVRVMYLSPIGDFIHNKSIWHILYEKTINLAWFLFKICGFKSILAIFLLVKKAFGDFWPQ